VAKTPSLLRSLIPQSVSEDGFEVWVGSNSEVTGCTEFRAWRVARPGEPCFRHRTLLTVRDAPHLVAYTGQLSIKPALSAHRTKLWARLPPAPSYPDAALSAGPAPPRDVPGTGRRGGSHGGRRAHMGRARLPGLSALWHSEGERIVHRLPYPAPDGTTALSLIDLGVSY
jgi:hypothetical protein